MSPDELLKHVGYIENNFEYPIQHDANEFLNSLLCLIDNEATDKIENSLTGGEYVQVDLYLWLYNI